MRGEWIKSFRGRFKQILNNIFNKKMKFTSYYRTHKRITDNSNDGNP